MNLEEKISTILFHLEEGNTEKFYEPAFQCELEEVIAMAVQENHREAEYLQSVLLILRGEDNAAAQKRWQSALKGNGPALTDYYTSLGAPDLKVMSLIKLYYDYKITDNLGTVVFEDYEFYLSRYSHEEKIQLDNLSLVMKEAMIRSGYKFK